MTDAVLNLIKKERLEQIEKHGRDIKSDLKNNQHSQLAIGASVMCRPPAYLITREPYKRPPHGWNVDIWTKMLDKPYEERLVIAGALIVAELECLHTIKNIEVQTGD